MATQMQIGKDCQILLRCVVCAKPLQLNDFTLSVFVFLQDLPLTSLTFTFSLFNVEFKAI